MLRRGSERSNSNFGQASEKSWTQKVHKPSKIIKLVVEKLLKRFDPTDRNLNVRKMLEAEILSSPQNLSQQHLTNIEMKVKKLLLNDKQIKGIFCILTIQLSK